MTATVSAAKAHDTADQFRDGTVTVEGLKAEYGMGRTMAYKLMGEGKLPFSQPYGRRLIPRRAVMQLLAAGMTASDE